MISISLENYITSNYVKYERLGPIISNAFAGSTDTHLNIYIDMNSVIRSLYNSKSNTKITNYKSLTACMINMCGHYREYFNKYLGVTTNIYIVMSNNCPDMNRKLVSGYNKTFYNKIRSNKLVHSLVRTNLDLLNNMTPYLPNIYLIESEFETAVTISAIIDKNNQSEQSNLIITRDIMNLQILPLYSKTALLRPKKVSKNGSSSDESFVIGPLNNDISMYNFWQYYYHDTNITDNNINEVSIHPCNLSLAMALTNLKGRNITDKLLGARKAKQYIYNCVQDAPVKCSIKTLYEMNPNLDLEVPRTVLESRYKAIDIQFAASIYKDSIQYKLLNFIDLEDPGSIKRINDQLFYDNPIDLEKL